MEKAFILLGSRRTFALKCALLTQDGLSCCEKEEDKSNEMSEMSHKSDSYDS